VLLALIAAARERAVEDPFGNPVLAAALAISRQLDDGRLDDAALAAIIAELRDAAAADRARRVAAYVGGTDVPDTEAALRELASRLIRPDPDDSPLPLRTIRAELERPRYACVFTAHPTFAASPAAYRAIEAAASGETPPSAGASHRPSKPTLEQEFDAATVAILNGRDAIDTLCGALLDAARPAFPQAWTSLDPAPIILASWVGLDTDGRTDIGWWDSMRLRLRMKRLGLARRPPRCCRPGWIRRLQWSTGNSLWHRRAQFLKRSSRSRARWCKAATRRCYRRNRCCRCSPAPSRVPTRRTGGAW
jgi:phosphoenolpyruvate carboxylase